jgi:hypothetical protein
MAATAELLVLPSELTCLLFSLGIQIARQEPPRLMALAPTVLRFNCLMVFCTLTYERLVEITPVK